MTFDGPNPKEHARPQSQRLVLVAQHRVLEVATLNDRRLRDRDREDARVLHEQALDDLLCGCSILKDQTGRVRATGEQRPTRVRSPIVALTDRRTSHRSAPTAVAASEVAQICRDAPAVMSQRTLTARAVHRRAAGDVGRHPSGRVVDFYKTAAPRRAILNAATVNKRSCQNAADVHQPQFSAMRSLA